MPELSAIDAWRRAVHTNITLPPEASKVADALAAHFRAGKSRTMTEREIVDAADVLDHAPLLSLLRRGWLARYSSDRKAAIHTLTDR